MGKKKFLIGFVIMLFSQIIFLVSYMEMQQVQNRVWLTKNGDKSELSAEEVTLIQNNFNKAEENIAFVAWTEKEEEVYAEGPQACQDVAVIYSSERADLLFVDVQSFDLNEPKSCFISSAFAFEIFGSENVEGLSVKCEESEYKIVGIFKEKNKAIICNAGTNPNVQFTEVIIDNQENKSPKMLQQRFEERSGANMRYVDFECLRILYECIFVINGLWIFVWMFRNVRRNNAEKVLIFGLVLLIVSAAIFVKFRGISPDFIPTRVSDRNFWKELFVEEKNNFIFLSRMKKGIPTLKWFQGSFCAFCSFIMYFFGWMLWENKEEKVLNQK